MNSHPDRAGELGELGATPGHGASQSERPVNAPGSPVLTNAEIDKQIAVLRKLREELTPPKVPARMEVIYKGRDSLGHPILDVVFNTATSDLRHEVNDVSLDDIKANEYKFNLWMEWVDMSVSGRGEFKDSFEEFLDTKMVKK